MTSFDLARVDPLVQRLKAVAEAAPDLKDAAQVYAAILPLIRDAGPCIAPLSVTADHAQSVLKTGTPLLDTIEIDLDMTAIHDLMIKLASVLESAGEQVSGDMLRLGSAAGRIRVALQEGRLDVGILMSSIASAEDDRVRSIAQDLDLDTGVLRTLSQNALRPAMLSCCRELTPLVEEIPWHRGFCFICGAEAALGELRDNQQARHLRCSQCGADWRVRRLQCPWCGNEDHRALGCLHAAEQVGSALLEVCDQCKGYLKVISAFTATSPEMLPIEDLATLHLDYIAQERGYKRMRSRQASS